MTFFCEDKLININDFSSHELITLSEKPYSVSIQNYDLIERYMNCVSTVIHNLKMLVFTLNTTTSSPRVEQLPVHPETPVTLW